jgi:hypothetical protein
MKPSADAAIVYGPRRLTSWPWQRKLAVALNLATIALALVAAGAGGDVWPLGLLAFVAGWGAADSLHGFPLLFRLFGLRRYLVWTFRCRRGRRCARLVVRADELDRRASTRLILMRLCWRCANCRTVYESEYQVPIPTIINHRAGRPL